MPKRILVGVLLGLAGCAPAAAVRPTTPAAVQVAAPAPSSEEREDVRALRGRVRELEAALGLAHAEVRDLREEVRALRAVERVRVTRIGGEDATEAPSDEGPRVEIEETSPAPRPVLRLYGSAPVVAAPTALPGPPAPAVVAAPPPPSLRLPVTPPEHGVPAIPALPVAVAPPVPLPAPLPPASAPVVPSAPVALRPPAAEDPGVVAYRAALAHLAERRLAPALAGLDAFLRDHPRHPYADNAQYWRGEIHYARRDYRRAIAEFTALVERYPQGNKVPEALLRIGLCHQRMGDPERARQAFRRLRSEFPESVAARMAPREDV